MSSFICYYILLLSQIFQQNMNPGEFLKLKSKFGPASQVSASGWKEHINIIFEIIPSQRVSSKEMLLSSVVHIMVICQHVSAPLMYFGIHLLIANFLEDVIGIVEPGSPKTLEDCS